MRDGEDLCWSIFCLLLRLEAVWLVRVVVSIVLDQLRDGLDAGIILCLEVDMSSDEGWGCCCCSCCRRRDEFPRVAHSRRAEAVSSRSWHSRRRDNWRFSFPRPSVQISFHQLPAQLFSEEGVNWSPFGCFMQRRDTYSTSSSTQYQAMSECERSRQMNGSS